MPRARHDPDADVIAVVAAAAAPDLDQGDLIFVSGALWMVRSALDDGRGQIKVTLERAQPQAASVGDRDFSMAFVGMDKDLRGAAAATGIVMTREAPVVGEIVEADVDWIVTAAGAWGAGRTWVNLAST
jgi:hypothetical protein